jgi:protein-disulfide isomerase
MNRGVMIVTGAGVAALIGAGAAALALGGAGQPVNTADKTAIERIVHAYILDHPEVLTQAMDNLQTRETAKLIDAHRAALEKPFGAAWEGAPDADVTLVQFFDYACGYCRANLPDIDRLLAEDKKLRVVYRELPILGQPSLDAAQVSLAVAQQGGAYGPFHRALYSAGRITPASLASARGKAGVSEAAVKAGSASAAVRAEIGSNLDLQQALQLTGTPAWIVGDQVLNGAVGYDALKAAIAKARQ